MEAQATRRSRLGKSSGASGARGVMRPWHAAEGSETPYRPLCAIHEIRFRHSQIP
jgi:hypothetical protein